MSEGKCFWYLCSCCLLRTAHMHGRDGHEVAIQGDGDDQDDDQTAYLSFDSVVEEVAARRRLMHMYGHGFQQFHLHEKDADAARVEKNTEQD